MAKKNYKKLLPKAGSTLAVAVAMSVALSTQVNATGLDDDGQQNNGNPLENGQNAGVNQYGTGLKENNEAVENQNGAVVEGNKADITNNQGIIGQNNAALEQNKDIEDLPNVPAAPDASQIPATKPDGDDIVVPDAPVADSQPVIPGVTAPDPSTKPEIPEDVQNPNLPDIPTMPDAPVLPDVPEVPNTSEIPKKPVAPDASGIPEKPVAPVAPNTDGMDVDEHNAAAGAYNDKVDEYNGKADDYNDAVDDYNDDVEDYNEDAGKYNDAVGDYNKDAGKYNDAVEDYNTEAGKYNDKANQYTDDMDDYIDAAEEYNKDAKEYNDAADAYNDKVDDYNEAAKDYNDAADKYEQDVADYNNAVDAYNQKVKDYNTAADAYNTAVDAYNTAASQYYNQALQNYNQALQDQAKDQALHEAAAAKYAADQAKLAADEAAKNTYLAEKDAYDEASAAYLEARQAYEDSLADGGVDAAAKAAFDAQKAIYEQAHSAYQEAVQAYNESLNSYDTTENSDAVTDAEFQQYLQNSEAGRAYLEAMAQYNNALTKYNTDSANYQQYLVDKAGYEAAYAAYLDELYAYNQGNKEQADKKQEIIDDVIEYNEVVADYNANVNDLNDALDKGIDGVADDANDLGEANNAVNVIVGEEIMAILNSYKTKLEELNGEATKLDNHAGKDAELGSAEYAEYLKAVEAYNGKVDIFNKWVSETYNPAVTTYNTAVDNYTPPTVPSAPSTNNGTQQGSTGIDWGNIEIASGETLGHIDVKYQAAASKDVTVENGVPSYSDSTTQYTVTGVYVSEAASNNGTSTSYGVNYDNDGSGAQTPGVQIVTKYTGEFAHDIWHNQAYGVVENINKNKSYYVMDNNGQFKKVTYSGGEWKTSRNNGTVYNPEEVDFYEDKKVELNPATGTVSFYVTLEDNAKKSYDINVSLNANSVYANGSYYKAQYKNGAETDYLDKYRDSNNNAIPVVWLKTEDGVTTEVAEGTPGAEKYYNISGKSVFLISALTCDGMKSDGDGNLNPDGLDLVLNLQTMIEIHKGVSPEKLAYKGYEEQTYKNLNETTTPGTNPDGFRPEWDKEVPPATMDAPTRLAAPVYDPGTYTPDQLTKPTKPAPLSKVEKLDRLEGKKLVVKFADVEKIQEIDPLDLITPVDYVKYINLDNLDPDADTIDEKKPVGTLEGVNTLGTLDKVDYAKHMDLRTKPVVPPVNPNPNPNPQPNPVMPLNDGGLVTIDDGAVPLADVPKTGDASVVFGAMSAFSGFGLALMQLFGRKKKEEN